MISSLKSKVVILALLFSSLIGISAVLVQAKVNPPITISYILNPPKQLNLANIYNMTIGWHNLAYVNYKGSFLFTVSGKNLPLSVEDIVMVYNGINITPTLDKEELQFLLPNQVFKNGGSGTVSVEVTYMKVGKFDWIIGVIQR
jgi:hypothetical protein